jgi:hypothetical protein
VPFRAASICYQVKHIQLAIITMAGIRSFAAARIKEFQYQFFQ